MDTHALHHAMRAAVVTPLLDETPVSVVDVPVPRPVDGWVLVRLASAALNRLDAMRIAGRAGLAAPAILGSDGAGVVVQVGAGVDPALIGTEVLVSPSISWGNAPAAPGEDYEILGLPTAGTHAEFVTVPAANVVPKPGSLTWDEAAALPMAGMTAWRALVSRGRLIAGETVVIGASSSGVGTFAVQIAASLGAHVIAVSSSQEKLDRACSLGAERTVLSTADDFEEQLVAATEGVADLALDPTGALWQSMISALKSGGRLVVVGRMAAHRATVDVQDVFWKQVDILGSSMGSPDDFAGLVRNVEAAPWRPVVDSTFGLEDVAAAYSRLDATDRFGKVTIRMPLHSGATAR